LLGTKGNTQELGFGTVPQSGKTKKTTKKMKTDTYAQLKKGIKKTPKRKGRRVQTGE